MPDISVVIPTYNRLSRLQQVIAALEQQTVAPQVFDVLVVSDGATDGTNEYLNTLQEPFKLQPVVQPNQGVAVARNTGFANATGRIILFIDDDVVPAPQLIAEHLRFHERYGAGVVVIGPMLNPQNHKMSPWVRWEQDQLAEQYHAMDIGSWEPTARQFYTGNTSLERSLLIDSGGFDSSFRRAEDVELAYRLAEKGLRFLFNPQAIGYHYAVRDFTSWLSTPYTYGRNDVLFSTQKGQAWLLDTIFEEFHDRHPLIQFLTKCCLDRPWLTAFTNSLLARIVMSGNQYQLANVASLACSGLFNLHYYQGVADGLSGRAVFFSGLSGTKNTYGNIN